MKCPRCHYENPPGSNFCLGCGTRLSATCGACGNDLPAGSRFCNKCGRPVSGESAEQAHFGSPESYTPKHLAEKIFTSKSALEGERKQVTVLFADLKGSMELLADRDPEDARKILDPVLERMMEAVHRYEGTVNQVMGDGIMALFGAPIAHEDHAVRACYAALRMQAEVTRYADEAQRDGRMPPQIRVGLNSGEVVVRSIGSDLRMDYTAVGQTTHLAARMEQIARAGSTLMTAATLSLAEGWVQVKPLGAVQIKGLETPTEIHELVGAGAARSRLQAALARGLSRFVGRDAELDALRAALDKAAAGHGQVVATVGEPGVGKSRLFWEFTHSHRIHGWFVLESGAVSYGRAAPYLPVIELLKAYFHILDRDDHREIREKITGKLLTLDRALEALLPALLALLDVPVDNPQWTALDPSQRRQRTLDGVKRLLLRESQVQPLVVVFEDLHWIDAETQACLDGLVEGLPAARLLLLVNYRPEYQHHWGGKTYYAQHRIDALPAAGAQELLQALLGDDPALTPLKELLAARTEGNPFFIEESVRTLVENRTLAGERGRYSLAESLPAVQVPVSVQAVLAARIDRLPPEDKQLLQIAAVIGMDVPGPLLEAVADLPGDRLPRGLAELQAAEFLYEARLFPEIEYRFKHALTHEVAYGGMLHERRRDLHGRVMAAIEALHARRLSEHIERLAQHALQAERWEKAVGYFREAGAKAIGRHAFRDVPDHLDRTLEALSHLPLTETTMALGIDARLELVPAFFALSRLGTLVEQLREAERLARLLDDRQRLAAVLAPLGWGLRTTGHLADAIEVGKRALALAVELRDEVKQLAAKYYVGQAYFAVGDAGRAVALWKEIVATAPQEAWVGGAVSVHVTTRAWLALALSTQGEFAEGIGHGEDALRLAEVEGRPFGIIIALGGLGSVYLGRGDLKRSIPLLERSRALGHSTGIVNWSPIIGGALARAYARSGRPAEGLSVAEDAVREEQATGASLGRAARLAELGEVYLLAGRPDDALAQTEQALELARRHGDRRNEANALHQLGEIHLCLDSLKPSAAEAHFHAALGLAEDLTLRPFVAHCHLGLGKLYQRIGKRRQAQEHLATATTMYREMGMTYWLEQAEAERRELA
jgi:class 3 adenylate cyclase/tetratricopeptide (TPR) repeat protein